MEKDNIQVDAYLMGELKGEVLNAFETSLASDDELKNQVEYRRKILDGVNWYGNKQLKEQLKDIHQKVVVKDKPQAKVRRLGILRWASAAAAVALLLVAATQWFGKAGSDELFADHYEAYDANFGTRDSDAEGAFKQAEDLYQNQAYAESVPVLNQLISEQPFNRKLQITLGNAYLNTGELEKAKATFNGIISAKDPFFEDKAHWYLALTHLKGGNLPAAKETLQVLAQDAEADHHQAALSLLKELE